jgi:hypothetical protein
MRKLLPILFLIAIQIDSYTQSLNDQHINTTGESENNMPADQVFLHIDRNRYQPGDTIRFQAYIRDRRTGIFETPSISLYALLLNSGHKTLDSARFRIINSTSSGWLEIPYDATYNDYSVLAFTSTMMNYGPEYAFKVPLLVDKLRPEQVESNQQPGEEKPAVLQSEASEKSLDLRFLPEGGTFINGLSQNLAFNAVNSFGANFKTEGSIINQNGVKICDFKSGQYGPGLVTFTPLAGNTYYAILKDPKFEGLRWPLPVADGTGVKLSASSLQNGIITISVEGKNVSGSNYIISMTMNNVVVLSRVFELDVDFSLEVNTRELPRGTACITLFNSDMKPLAERLILVNGQKKLNISIETSAAVYKRGDLAELAINATDNEGNNAGAVVSVSVIDSLSGFSDRFPFPDIESALLFEKEFYDNLPIGIRLKGLSDIPETDMDLLLLTYGWRKFRMKEESDTVVIRELKNYDYLKIINSGPVKKSREKISLLSLEGSEIYSLKVDKNKESFLAFDSLAVYVRQLIILPDKNKERNVYPVNIELPGNRIYTDRAKLNKTGEYTLPLNIEYKRTTLTDFGLDSAIMIEPITIKASPEPGRKFVNKYQEQYRNTSTTTLTNKEFKSALFFENILFQMHPYKIDTKNKMVFLGFRTGRSELPALIVVDDNPLWGIPNFKESKWLSTYSEIADMHASDISSVTMLKGQQGFTLYGEAALGGVIFVTTNGKAMMDGSYEKPEQYEDVKNDLAKPIRIFRSEIEFYTPKKEEVQFDPEFQFRPTLLWKNELILDGIGPVKLVYPNNLVRGTVIIIVNGVSFNNIPFYKSIRHIIN